MKYKRKTSRIHEPKAINNRNRTSIHEWLLEADGEYFGDWETELIVVNIQDVALHL
ncbi:MAG: hypothetical protein K2H16_01425 [Prevotella sp.]|nr:hypothetical protein [Prevotella sp.]